MSSTPQPAAPAPGGRRRRFKWTRRIAFFCSWLVIMLACLAALAAGLAWIGQQNATRIANVAREQLAPDHPIHIGSVAFPELGLVELRDITLNLPEGGRRAASIGRIRLRYDPNSLPRPRIESLLIEAPVVSIDDELLELFAAEANAPPGAPPDLDWIKVDKLKLVDGQIQLDLAGLPTATCKVDLEALDIDLGRDGASLSAAPQLLTLRDLVISDPHRRIATPLATAAKLEASVRLNKDFISGTVDSAAIERPVVHFTPDFMAALQTGTPTTAAPPETSTPEAMPGREPLLWSIGEIDIDRGYFEMRGFHDTPDVSFQHSGRFSDLSWSSDAGISWPGKQGARLTDVRIDAHDPRGTSELDPGSKHLFTATDIDIAAIPDEFLKHGWLERIAMRNPVIHVTEERVRRFLTKAPGDRHLLLLPPTDDTADQPPATDRPAFFLRPRSLEISGAQVEIEAEGFISGLPASTFTLDLHSADKQPDPDNNVHYQLSATDLSIHPPPTSAIPNPFWKKAWQVFGNVLGVDRSAIPPLHPIVTGREILIEFTAAGVQREQRIDNVTLSGIEIRIDPDVSTLISDLGKDKPKPEAEPVSAPEPIPEREDETPTDPEWKISQLEFEETRFILEDFIPGLPYVPLELHTTLEEIPLSGRDSGDERMQRVELRNLEITSRHNSLLPVARLRSIWIHFTVPGLIRNEIDRVELVSPEVYLGEHLFWYIDHYRSLAAAKPAPAADTEEPQEVAALGEADPCTGETDQPPAGEAPAEGKIGMVEDAFKNTEFAGWRIKYVDATAGKIIVAPKGYPIGIVPFPFSAKTNLAEGKIELDFKVPPADYVFEQLELELRDLHGEAFLNYPIRKEDNNFVQTFEAAEILFKDYEADEVYLSITYDENGIYGHLGAAAYGGYANAAFNIYIGETYKWDAWVTGSDLDLTPISDILAPETIRVSGILDAKIVANGEGLEPGRIAGDMKTSGPCHMHVSKLDDLLEAIPDEWDALYKALSEAGIEAFRHYDFTSGTANLELDGRDGTASMLLDGPDGKRDLLFRLHDQRALAGTAKKTE